MLHCSSPVTVHLKDMIISYVAVTIRVVHKKPQPKPVASSPAPRAATVPEAVEVLSVMKADSPSSVRTESTDHRAPHSVAPLISSSQSATNHSAAVVGSTSATSNLFSGLNFGAQPPIFQHDRLSSTANQPTPQLRIVPVTPAYSLSAANTFNPGIPLTSAASAILERSSTTPLHSAPLLPNTTSTNLRVVTLSTTGPGISQVSTNTQAASEGTLAVGTAYGGFMTESGFARPVGRRCKKGSPNRHQPTPSNTATLHLPLSPAPTHGPIFKITNVVCKSSLE